MDILCFSETWLNGWLHVENRRSLLLLLNTYKLTNAPDFHPAVTDSMGTRSHDRINFTIPRPTSDKFLKSYYYLGRSLWNRLPVEDQGLPDPNWFKRRVKRSFLLKKLLFTAYRRKPCRANYLKSRVAEYWAITCSPLSSTVVHLTSITGYSLLINLRKIFILTYIVSPDYSPHYGILMLCYIFISSLRRKPLLAVHFTGCKLLCVLLY